MMEYRETWKLVDGDVHHHFRAPGLEYAVRNGARNIIREAKKSGFSPIEKSCELKELDKTRDNSVCIQVDFSRESPEWKAYYRTRIKDGKISLAQAKVGHDLRSEWFGVTIPILVFGESESMYACFDTDSGEKTIRGDRNQITAILRQNGYLISPFDLSAHSDY